MLTLHNTIQYILNTIIQYINHLGYLGIGLGMLLESACIPLPSELVLPLGGYMVADGRISLLQANIAATLGSILGSLLAYFIGYFGGRPLILKYGKYFFLSKDHFLKAEKTFITYGNYAVFFGRLLPVIRTFISLPAGIAKMDIRKFIVFSLVGMIPWNFILIFFGYKFGKDFERIVDPIYHKIEYVVIACVVLIILYIIFKRIFRQKGK